MRIALVCGYFDPMRDGVADYTRQLAGHIRSAGLDPLVITTYELARAAGGAAVGVTARWDMRGAASADRALRRLKPDVVHVQFAPSVFRFSRTVGLLPLLLPSHLPLVVTLHEYGVRSGEERSGGLRAALWSAVERREYADRETLLLVPRATRLLVPSAEHLNVVRARFPRQAERTVEVPIGRNVDIVAVDRAATRVEVRHESGAAPDAWLVVFFGFLHPEKSLDQLIAAVAAVRKRRPDTHLLLIGGEESHSVPTTHARQLRQALQHIATGQGMGDHVHFTGYLPDAEVSRLLQAADVAAFPFTTGVTRKSSSLLAALAAGLPVIATAPPGTPAEADEADGVLWVPPNDPRVLAEALTKVLSDSLLAERLRTAGRARLASQSWDTIAAVHSQIYAEVVAAPVPGRSWTRAAQPAKVVPSTLIKGDVDVSA